MRAWLVPSLTGALGIVVGLSFAALREPRHTATESGVPIQAHPFAARSQDGAVNNVAGVARESEMTPRDSHAQTAMKPEQTSVDSIVHVEPPTPDHSTDDETTLSAAAQQAIATVEAAIIRGSWTANDAAILRTEFYALPRIRQEELLQALIVAVNQDRVVIETQHFPF